jgi:hypothetical protein
MSTSVVVIITGTIPLDLNITSRALTYLIKLGCQIQSSNLHGTIFLYTLVKPNSFCMLEDEFLKTLEGIERSANFSVTYA